MKPDYRTRTLQHSLLWLNGIVRHNTVDDECVIDFSCCVPELFTGDKKKRQRKHAELIDRLRN